MCHHTHAHSTQLARVTRTSSVSKKHRTRTHTKYRPDCFLVSVVGSAHLRRTVWFDRFLPTGVARLRNAVTTDLCYYRLMLPVWSTKSGFKQKLLPCNLTCLACRQWSFLHPLIYTRECIHQHEECRIVLSHLQCRGRHQQVIHLQLAWRVSHRSCHNTWKHVLRLQYLPRLTV